MEETYGMGAGASVRKGKTAKQVKRARKNINLAKKTTTKAITTLCNLFTPNSFDVSYMKKALKPIKNGIAIKPLGLSK